MGQINLGNKLFSFSAFAPGNLWIACFGKSVSAGQKPQPDSQAGNLKLVEKHRSESVDGVIGSPLEVVKGGRAW